MNLGGRRITNTDLCASFEGLGFTGVGAFLASGNVVFDGKGSATALAKRVESGLEDALGYPVPTFIRSAAQVRAVAACDPFADRRGAAGRGKLQVVFLRSKPSAKAAAGVADLAEADDWLAIEGAELYWLPKAGLADSNLDMKALAKLVGPPTVRTKNTIVRLAAKFFAD